MAELSPPPQPRLREQLAAIAQLRWRLMVNGLRTTRGAWELVARIWVGLWFGLLALGVGAGCAAGTYYFISQGHPERTAVLLWGLLVFWQVFPLAASAFSEPSDVTGLARYPLDYRAYAAVRIAFGSLDIATLVGGLGTLGVAAGIGLARPSLLGVGVTALLGFVAVNVLLAQVIFAWLERWLAQRRTREVLGLLFFLVIFGFNFIAPIMRRMKRGDAGGTLAQLRAWLPVERWLPGGMPAHALAAGMAGRAGVAAAAVAALWALAVGLFGLLDIRLRAEYRGEVLSDNPGRPRRQPAAKNEASRGGRRLLPGGAVGAVAEKELRYLLRSPMMFFTLVIPVLMVLFIRTRAPQAGRGLAWQTAGLGFPIGMAYALLVLTGLIFNTMATDAAGVQFYFLAPVRFRDILMGKNLAHGLILAFEMVLLYVAATLLEGPPAPRLLAYTVLGLVFAALCDFSCGNLLSLLMPKKIDLARLGRQAGRGTSSIVAIVMQALIGGMIAIAIFGGAVLGRSWISWVLLTALTATAAALYGAVLARCEGVAQAHRETLIAELSRA